MSAILAILIWPIGSALTIVLISVTADYIESFINKIIKLYQKNPSDFILYIFGVFGFFAIIYGIIDFNKYESSLENKNVVATRQADNLESQDNKGVKVVSLGNSKGKYGQFTTYIDENNILKREQYMSLLIIDYYEKCTTSMPYCMKDRIITVDCKSKKFIIEMESTRKDGKIVKETVFEKDKVKIKKASSSAIISKLINKYCQSSPTIDIPSNIAPHKKEGKPSYYIPPNNPSLNYKAVCKDGTYSYSTGRGTCSHHGGVSRYL